MKITYVLTLSTVFALTSLVAATGCSAPAPGKDGKDAKAQSQSEEDPDEKESPTGAKTTPKDTPATTPSGTTPAATTASQEACDACLAAAPKMGAVLKCEEAAKDEAAADKCYEDICGADKTTCDAEEAKCADKCEGPPPTAEEVAAFETCMSANPKGKALVDCEKKCKDDDDACFEGCWVSSGCSTDQACQDLEEKCFGDD